MLLGLLLVNCDISMDESREIIQGVSQDMLETTIPRRGGPVLVLSGKPYKRLVVIRVCMRRFIGG
jgi:hypothetical protein